VQWPKLGEDEEAAEGLWAESQNATNVVYGSGTL
jgi:hypothetical protein